MCIYCGGYYLLFIIGMDDEYLCCGIYENLDL